MPKTKQQTYVPVVEPVKLPCPIRFYYEPGNGTRFDVWLTKCDGTIIVSLLNFRSCWEFKFPPSPGYAGEKLRLEGTDAEHIAALIAKQF
jgi:hypothetical protein